MPVTNYAAVSFVVEADFNTAPVTDCEASAKGNSATSDCELELIGV